MPIDEKLSHWADKEYTRGNFPSAAEKLQMGLAKCQDDLDARKKLRLIARKNLVTNPVKGMAKMKKATMTTKLRATMKMKRAPGDIADEAERVLFEEPNDISTLQSLAAALEQLELFDVAIWVLDDAIKLEPKNVELWSTMGIMFQEKLKDFEECKRCFEKVLHLDSTKGEILKRLRSIEAEKAMVGDKVGAKKGIQVKDVNEAMRDEILRKIIRNGADAIAQNKFFLQDLAKDPKNIKIMEKIADRYRQGEMYKECIEFLEKALSLESTNETIKIRMGEVKLQQAGAVKEKYYLAKKKNPKDPKLVEGYRKANIFELKMGIKVYDEWVIAHPTDLRMKFRYGEYLYRGQKFKEALSMFQKSAGDPKMVNESNEFLGRCFMKLKKFKLAIKPLDNFLSNQNEGSDPWKEGTYLKAQCQKAMGDEETSQLLFEKIYEVDIDFRDVADLI